MHKRVSIKLIFSYYIYILFKNNLQEWPIVYLSVYSDLFNVFL